MNTIVLEERTQRRNMPNVERGTSDDEHAIRKAVTAWHAATSAGEVSDVLALMSEDVTVLAIGQLPTRGRANVEASLRAFLATHTVESHVAIQEAESSGDLGYCRSVPSVPCR